MALLRNVLAIAAVGGLAFGLSGCVGSGGGTGNEGVDPGTISGVYTGTLGQYTIIMEIQQNSQVSIRQGGNVKPLEPSGPTGTGGYVIKSGNTIVAVGYIDTSSFSPGQTGVGVSGTDESQHAADFEGEVSVDYNPINQVVGMHGSVDFNEAFDNGTFNVTRTDENLPAAPNANGSYVGTATANGQTADFNANFNFDDWYNTFYGSASSEALANIDFFAALIDGHLYVTTQNGKSAQVKPSSTTTWEGFLSGTYTFHSNTGVTVDGTFQTSNNQNPQSGSFHLTED